MSSLKSKKDMPGPANYTLPSSIGCNNGDMTKRKYPCYSIGKRHTTIYQSVGPGPAIYHPGKCTRFGVDKKSAHIGARLKYLKEFETPAPNAYELPDILGEKRVPNAYQKRSPAYSFGNRYKHLATQEIPAPNTYVIPPTIGAKGQTVGFPKAPSYTMGDVVKEPARYLTPSPAEYFPQPHHNNRKIHMTIKPRIKDLKTFETPGPNTYNLQAHQPGPRSPAFTMRKRIEI